MAGIETGKWGAACDTACAGSMQDDDVISMGGTFARLAQEGLEVRNSHLQNLGFIDGSTLLRHFTWKLACVYLPDGAASSCSLKGQRTAVIYSVTSGHFSFQEKGFPHAQGHAINVGKPRLAKRDTAGQDTAGHKAT
jgi:hypothetical protein